MKKLNPHYFLFLLFFGLQVHCQTSSDSLLPEKKEVLKKTYKQLDFSIPLVYDVAESDNNDASSLLPGGINALFGYGYDYKNLLGIGLHTGINTRWDEKLVAVPVFGNIRISPKIGKKHFLSLQAGYGKAFALGRGDLSGDYKKINIGLGNTYEIIRGAIFVEYNEMDFPINDRKKIAAVSLGVSFYFF